MAKETKSFTGRSFFILIVVFSASMLAADTNYVVPPGTLGVNPTPAYLSWATAATSIIDAVNASSNNNVVLVTNGNYCLTNAMVVNKTITLISVNGRNQTFVDGNATHQCMKIIANAVVSGFTISNGYATTGNNDTNRGAGVHMTAGVLTNCIISQNRSDAEGYAGIYCRYTNTLIVDCIVTGNSSAGSGGGVWLYDGVTVRNCKIVNNSATNGNGGGAYLARGSFLSNCEVVGNSAQSGAGVCVGNTSGDVIDSCLIASNHVTVIYGSGAGIALGIPSPTNAIVRNCTIRDNYGDISPGGGVGVSMSKGNILQNCLITRNGTSGDRGAVLIDQISAYTGYVANCTIVSNQGSSWGGLTVIGLTNDNSVFNCVIASNTPNNIHITGGGGALAGTSNAFWYCSAPGFTSFPPGRNNITNDPAFVDAIPGNTNNWRLANNSPCLNRGTNMSWMTNSVDLDGRARIRYGTVDMGAYEKINEATVYNFR